MHAHRITNAYTNFLKEKRKRNKQQLEGIFLEKS